MEINQEPEESKSAGVGVNCKKHRLNPKKIAFIQAYTTPNQETFHNGSKSARFAGYSDHSASEIACKLLKQPEVASEIQARDTALWDWDFEKWSQEVTKSASEVDSKHSNRPRFLELIAKSKGWLTERTNVSNNLYVLGGQDLQSIRSSIVSLLASERKSGVIIGRGRADEKGPMSESADNKEVTTTDLGLTT